MSALNAILEWSTLTGIDEITLSAPINHFIPPQITAPAIQEKPIELPLTVQIDDKALDTVKTLDDLKEYYTNPALFPLLKTATHTLFGQGQDKKPKIMIIGEQPKRQEDVSGHCFSSPSGQLCRNFRFLLDENEDDIYYTYLSKWRPPGGRKLNQKELSSLTNPLKKQINIIKPQCVVTLGEQVLKALTSQDVNYFKKQVGKVTNIQLNEVGPKIALLPLFNEGFLLKTPQLKKATWLSIVNCKGDLLRQTGQ